MKRFLLAASLAATASPAGRAADPPAAPFLRIEAGMHTARVGRISTDATGRLALTCSDDKTARLWELNAVAGNYSATLLRVFRPPIGGIKEGMLNACALNPQATLVAVGGWTGTEWDTVACVYLFDAASGRLVRRLTQVDGIIMDLSFSASGRHLAAALGSGAGLKVWDANSGNLVAHDGDYGERASFSVDWFGDEKLVTTCDDGRVRLYRSANFAGGGVTSPAAVLATKTAKQPFDVRFSPDGNQLAVAYEDAVALTIHSGANLQQLESINMAGILNGRVQSVSWLRPARGGPTVAAGGTWRHESGYHQVRLWSRKPAGFSWAQDAHLALNGLQDLCPLPAAAGGGLLWSSAHPSWGVLAEAADLTKPDGPTIFRGQLPGGSPIIDYRTSVRISPDASLVAVGTAQNATASVRFSILERRLDQIPADDPPAAYAASVTDGLPIENWKNHTAPTFSGQPLKMQPNEISRSLAVASDRKFFVLGTEFYLRCHHADGREKWVKRAPGVCWRLALSADNGLVVAAYADGTLRWHRTSDGAELIALFPHGDRSRWVVWTPSGYYDCSAKGENLIGWHVNRGKAQAADFFPAGKFRDRFYQPDVIPAVLQARDEATGKKLALAVQRQKVEVTQDEIIAMMQPPVVELAVGGGASVVTIAPAAAAAEIRYRIRRTNNAPVTRVRILINGRPAGISAPVPATDAETAAVSVPVPGYDCLLAVMAENRYAASIPSVVRVSRGSPTAGAQQAPTPKSRLFVLSVGISDYSEKSSMPDLHFAAKDGRDFASCFQRQEGLLYQKVETRLLTDADATAANVLDGLDWIKSQTTAADVCAVLMAGHGENDAEGRYYFCPHDYDRERRLRSAVSLDDIRKTMAAVPGKVLFFVDTCHAGNALGKLATGTAAPDVNRVVNELSSDESGAVLFASSTGWQTSQEHGNWQNGAFTKAVVEGLSGGADLLNTGKITIASLETYISERVKTLTGGSQTPTVAKPQTVPDFPIALKR